MGRTLLSRALLGAVVAALSLGEASAAVGRHQWPLPLPRQRLSSTSVVTGGRRLTRIRGGATEEWVCNGDVCELKPKAAGAANDAVSRRKAKRGKRGAGASDAEAAEPLSAAPGFLKVLQAYFKGEKSLGSVTAALLRSLGRLLGGGSAANGLPAKGADSEEVGCGAAGAKAGKGGKKAMKGKGGGAAAAATVAKAPAPTKRAGGRRRGGPSRASAAVRIQRELMDFQQNSPPSLSVNVRADNMNVWVVTLNGVEGTLFEGEKHKLRIEFPREYPAKPPSVYFLKPTPRHPHVYTNGDICLDLLGKGWKPQITTRTLAISILSMLSSAKEKGIPPDNSNHADNAPGRPQEGWLYHDDHC